MSHSTEKSYTLSEIAAALGGLDVETQKLVFSALHRHSSERVPMWAYRDLETRKQEIRQIVGFLYMRQPALFDDIDQLAEPPAPDERAIAEGYGPYGHDVDKNTWNHLVTDVVAKPEEIRAALVELRGDMDLIISEHL